MHRWSAVILTVLVAACGPQDDNGGGNDGAVDASSVESLVISPADVVLVVEDGVQVQQVFVATAHYSDGSSQDVSSEAVWSVDDLALGVFAGATFTATGGKAGQSTVRATHGGAATSTSITVEVQIVRIVDLAPGNAADLFEAATEDAGLAPTIVYPADQTLVPPNLGDFEVHWMDTAGCDLFEVSLRTEHLDLRAYVTGTPLVGSWLAFLAEEWAMVRQSTRGDEITLQVRGLTIAAPETAGTAGGIAVGLANEDIVGGIYYWAAASASMAEGIYRHDFSWAGEPAEEFYTTNHSPAGRCVACHAISRAGDRMSITFDGGNGPASILDVATRTPILDTEGTFHWNFAAFHPEGTRVLTTYGGVMTLRNPETGEDLGVAPSPGWATHADWAPGGDAIVYVVVGSPGADWHFGGGRLVTQPFDLSTDTFGTETELVPAEASNIYYPAWSPDGQWIAFNKSTEDAYDDATAQLWAIKADGSQAPIYLASADVANGLTNSWSRWAPFEQVYSPVDGTAEPLLWLTFSSKRDFGVRLVGAGQPQVWMTAFFPQRAENGLDPCTPSFRLPFQALESNNHIAQWTEVVIPVQ